MDEPADTSSHNRPAWYLVDGRVSTRNRKVVGSNPTSGSKSAGQEAFLTLLTARLQPAVIPLGWISGPQANAPRFARWSASDQ
jgi:hypothetical protein